MAGPSPPGSPRRNRQFEWLPQESWLPAGFQPRSVSPPPRSPQLARADALPASSGGEPSGRWTSWESAAGSPQRSMGEQGPGTRAMSPPRRVPGAADAGAGEGSAVTVAPPMYSAVSTAASRTAESMRTGALSPPLSSESLRTTSLLASALTAPLPPSSARESGAGQRRSRPLVGTGIDVAKHVNGAMDMVVHEYGSKAGNLGGQTWDKLGNTDLEKRLHAMANHSRSGHYSERYGINGRYEGGLLYGRRHGRGFHESQGERYEGEWKWDLRHGWGELKLPDGSSIVGNWESGRTHGYATQTDKTGRTVYEGEYKDGRRHGLGRQYYESGDSYEGGWCEGRLHDKGVYYYANGDKFYGQWSKGKYDGTGVYHRADGTLSRRLYRDGLLVRGDEANPKPLSPKVHPLFPVPVC